MESATAVFGNITEGAQNGMDIGRVIRMIIETCPECGGELKHLSLTTYPPIPKKVCTACGWSWTGEPDKIEYVPFDDRRQLE